jgi:hypothetical protein
MASRSSGREWQHPALTEAIRIAKLPKRKPSEDDRPRPSTFSGLRPKLIPGQLALGHAERENDAAA